MKMKEVELLQFLYIDHKWWRSGMCFE